MPLIATLNLSAVQADQASHHLLCSVCQTSSCQGLGLRVRALVACQGFARAVCFVRPVRLHSRAPRVDVQSTTGALPWCATAIPFRSNPRAA